MARLDRDLAEVRARGVTEGEAAKAALLQRADEEAERVRREAQEEIARRLAFATQELRRTAADLTAAAAIEKVSAEITEEDRNRLLADSVGSLSRPS
jgi:F0F1-type ATP synthase membrane subunit b/b'